MRVFIRLCKLTQLNPPLNVHLLHPFGHSMAVMTGIHLLPSSTHLLIWCIHLETPWTMGFRADVLLDNCAACLHEVKLNNSPRHVLICIYTHMSTSMLQKYMQNIRRKLFSLRINVFRLRENSGSRPLAFIICIHANFVTPGSNPNGLCWCQDKMPLPVCIFASAKTY